MTHRTRSSRRLLHPEPAAAEPVHRLPGAVVPGDLQARLERGDSLHLLRGGPGRSDRRDRQRGGDSEDEGDALHCLLLVSFGTTSRLGAVASRVALAHDAASVLAVTPRTGVARARGAQAAAKRSGWRAKCAAHGSEQKK